MERLYTTPKPAEDFGRGNIQKYVADVFRFRNHMASHLERSSLDAKSQAITNAFFDDFYKMTRWDGVMYRSAYIPLVQPYGVEVTPTSDEKVAAGLFAPIVKTVDDIIDSPACPQFPTSRDLKDYVWNQKVELDGYPEDVSIAHLSEILLTALNPTKQDYVTSFVDGAMDAHWQYNPAKVGDYDFNDAINYRRATTVEWFKTVRKVMNIQDPPEAEPALAAQLLDDALDVLDDVPNNRINMWVGMARDNGELDILLSEMEKNLRLPELVRGKMIRRKMPITLTEYSRWVNSESDKKRDAVSRFLGRFFLRFV